MIAVDRRAVLGGTMGLAAASFLWGCVGKEQSASLSAAQMALLSKLSDLVIPRTDTPGAIEVGVPAFVAMALKHRMGGTGDPKAPGAPEGNDYGAWLETTFGRDFTAKPATEQIAIIGKIDSAAYAKDASPSPWKALKGLILTGYFTSEAGASKALRYELVPGRFDPDLPIRPGDTSWSSDWTALDFG